MNVFQKIKWFLAVLGVFLIILATNLIDKKNFLRVEESVDKIYNERLLAKELLLDITIKFHQKELAYALNDSNYLKFQNNTVNEDISTLLELFERSDATKKEKLILNNLNKNHLILTKLESNSLIKDTIYDSECINTFAAINTNIIELSAEQVKEGKHEKFYATEAVNSVKLFSQIEIYMLIILALILQVIIFYSPKKKSNNT